MANIRSFPNNQNEYIGAEDVMRWLHGRTSGVFGADGNAAVAPVMDAMAVTVSDGNGWISNDKDNGVVWWIDNEVATGGKLQLSIDMADAVLPRIDRVIVSWQTTNYVALPEVTILKGTAASTPVAPELTNNNILRQISLAAIHIPAGTTAITSLMIVDERLNPKVCGIVTDRVAADTSMVNEQYLAAVKELRAAIQQAWNGEIPNGSITQEMLDPNIKLGSNDIYIGTEEPTGDDRPKLWIDSDDNREEDKQSMELLWENASPGSNFAAQTVALDLTAFAGVFITYRNQTGGSVYNSTGFVGKGDGFALIYVPTVSSSIAVTRKGTVDEHGVNFLANSNDDNKYHIPLKIYGIKGVIA